MTTNAFAALEQIEALLATLDYRQRQWITEVLYEKWHDMMTLEDDE
jgi:hypothetical protein